MAFKSYHTMNGQIIGESEGTRSTDYILDGLGSVIGTFRTTGTIQNQYRYSGYGQLVHKSGTGSDPYFLWVGGWGYRTRGMVYVRRRVFNEDAAVWTSVDPLWPDESAYGYARLNPITLIDPLGLKPGCSCKPTVLTGVPKTNPSYRCFLNACEWYCGAFQPPFTEADCSGWPSCNGINRQYPPCMPSDRCYARCHTSGGNPTPGGGQPLPTWCCVECQIRVCCHVECPLEEDLQRLLEKKFQKCQNFIGPPSPPLPEPPPGWPWLHQPNPFNLPPRPSFFGAV